MEEITFSMVNNWLKIEEGSLEDYRRELNKQPLREAVVLAKIESEQKILTDIEQELREAKYDLDKTVAELVVEYKRTENPKSQSAIENFRKYDLELDPRVVTRRQKILDLQKKRDAQQDYLNSWKGIYQLLQAKRLILMTNIKSELALQGINNLTETI